ncbi:MAG: AAA family ATPase [Pseudomonadota bacterium]
MQIDNIAIENFKGLDRFERQLHPRFTLIVGDNGRGKSSILDALSVAFGAFLLGIPHARSRSIQRHEVRETARFYENRPDFQQHYPVRIAAEGSLDLSSGPSDHRISWERTLEGPSSRTTARGARPIKSIARSAYNSILGGNDVTLPLLSYYGAGRLWNEPRHLDRHKKPSRFDAFRNSHEPRVSSADLIQWVRDQRLAELDEERRSPSLKAWSKAVENCFDGPVRIEYSLRRTRLEVEFGERSAGGSNVAYSNLSSGQRTVLSMVGDIAFKALALNPHLGSDAIVQTPGIVLIDEIDLHLHPLWQRGFIPALQNSFPNIQFVATTHSPFIIQSLRDGMVLNLDTQEEEWEAYNLAIEDIAEGVQQVPSPQRSQHHLELQNASEEYYQLLDDAGRAKDADEIAEKRSRLDKVMERFADDPAAAALLKFKRTAAKIDD